jgi:hypothetical protein
MFYQEAINFLSILRCIARVLHRIFSYNSISPIPVVIPNVQVEAHTVKQIEKKGSKESELNPRVLRVVLNSADANIQGAP